VSVPLAKPTLGAEPEALAAQVAKADPNDKNASPPSAFELMESEAMSFVKQHHPELFSLLQLLKAMKEKEFEVAIRDIDKARKRLDSLSKSDSERHQIELDSWKIQSKIDLLLAKGFAQDKAFNAKTLRGLIKDQVENQKRRLKNEQSNLLKRKRQIDEQLVKFEGQESERVDQQFAALMKRVDAKVGKPAKAKPETKPTDGAKE
jgi:cellobiose-specific phosphotransferase system component IIA